jgi:hypothetical protein
MFRDADEETIQKLLTIKKSANTSKGLPCKECVQQLREYMIKSHLRQYVSMVRQLLSYGTDNEGDHRELMKDSSIDLLQSILLELEDCRIDYRTFIIGVIKIRDNSDHQN